MSDQNKIGSISISYGNDSLATLENLGRASSKQAAKINTLVHSLYPHDDSGRGGVSVFANDYRYSMDINLLAENGINSMLTGLDGTSIYTFAGNRLVGGLKEYVTLHPIFYKMDSEDSNIHRPHTIYETFISLMDWVRDEISNIESVSAGESCITDCSYTKNMIGERAFSPGAPLTSGSIMWNVDRLLCYVNQLREETLGESYSFRSYGGGDCSGKSACSLSDKVDAILSALGAEEGEGCSITIDPVTGGGGCLTKYVETFTPANGTNIKIDPSGPTRVASMNDELWTYDIAEGDTLSDFLGGDLDSFFSEPDRAPPVALVPKLHLLEKEAQSPPSAVMSQWIWNTNGAHSALTTEDPFEEDPWKEDTDGSRIRMDTPFNLNITYQYLNSVDSSKLDMQAEIDTFFEITLYGPLEEGYPIAKYNQSLRDLTVMPFTPRIGDGSGIFLSPGHNKLCLLKDISFNDFMWSPPLGAMDLVYDPIPNSQEKESHLISHAVITLITRPRPGGSIEAALGLHVNRRNFEAAVGQLYLINAEIEWFDPGCEVTPRDPDLEDSCDVVGEVEVGDTETSNTQSYIGFDGNTYTISIEDHTMNESNESTAAGICEESLEFLMEL